MFGMSQNYRLRKYYLERDQVPTQSLMKTKMCPALADVYFKSMTPKLKVYAGLEPPLIGGGNSWYVPPEELLQQRVVLKPIKKEYMAKLNYSGIDVIGMQLVLSYRKHMEEEKERIINNHHTTCKQHIVEVIKQHELDCRASAAKADRLYIKNVVQEFEVLYCTSITKFQNILFDASVNAIKRTREVVHQKMLNNYTYLVRQQAIKLNDKYTKNLTKTKSRLKANFLKDLKSSRSSTDEKLHDINVEKHVAVEKLRQFLECQTLANQVYVALIERQQCSNILESAKRIHKKSKIVIEREITYKDNRILYARDKERSRLEYETMWQKKLSHVLKTFQHFVSYCLNMLPEQAEFFTNLEKLLLLQLEEAVVCPRVASIIIKESETFRSPVARPHPFYLFYEKCHKPNIEQNLCPKHCTSSASHLPVIIINKQCIYSACDNLEQMADKVKDYVDGKWEVDQDMTDNHDYSRDIPVTYTFQDQKQELKLESSLLQILQQEIANARNLPIECEVCEMQQCFSCSTLSTCSEISMQPDTPTPTSVAIENTDKIIWTRQAELKFEREPKMESYLKHIQPKMCSNCSKMSKKHLFENLPTYMRKMSPYDAPEMLNYETCSILQLKQLVKEANKTISPARKIKLFDTKKEIACQTSDYEFEYLCTCFSDDSVEEFLDFLAKMHPRASNAAMRKTQSDNIQGAYFESPFPQSTTAYLAKKSQTLAAIRSSYFGERPVTSSKVNIIDCICPH